MNDFDDPKNWKWGMIYYNKEDDRVVVPKRNPMMGITFNFANPKTYVVVTVIILVIALFTKLAIAKTKL